MMQSAQRKMLRLITQTKRRYKKIVKHKVKTSEDFNNIDSSCTDVESEDGKSCVSHNDQDSDVSFESDNDEEIDAAEIEEEDWVDYIKRSTNEAMEKMVGPRARVATRARTDPSASCWPASLKLCVRRCQCFTRWLPRDRYLKLWRLWLLMSVGSALLSGMLKQSAA